MKRLLILLVVFLNIGCGKFLTDYSQDLVIVKTTTDLDELMLGSAYLPSVAVNYFVTGRNASPFLNFLDDDINSVIGVKDKPKGRPRDSWINAYIYGYTTWQLDVSRSYENTEGFPDDLTWLYVYNRINVVNMILAELNTVPKNTETERLAALRIEGEALFLRAQYYLLLSNLYGDAYDPNTADTKLTVPLKLTEYVEHQGGVNQQFSRATAKVMYTQIVEDLKKSIACFEESPQANKLYRASGPASKLLLSRVYLYMQDWENAFQTANSFLTKNSTLTNVNTHDPLKVLINEDNREVIFSHGSLNLTTVLEASSDDFCVSRDLYSLYDDEDSRKNIYFGIHADTDSVLLFKKYERDAHRSYVSDIFMLRNAEGYLNLAEAAAMLGNTAVANKALNDLRESRIKNYIAESYDANTVIDQVRNERRKELCFEGHRWFDLRRYAVNQIKPFQKEIIRYFSAYSDSPRKLIQTEIYRLPIGDPAYTFSLPKSVIEFEPGLINNPREPRPFESLVN